MKVLIIGGVAGGATTATRLRRLSEDIEIIIFERGKYVSYANCGIPYYIGDEINSKEKLLLQTPESFKARFNIDVRVNSEVINIDRDKKQIIVKNLESNIEYIENYDKLVISTGAKAVIPNIPIESKDKVFVAKDVSDAEKIKEYININKPKTATVIGGGYIGIEMAENLSKLGINVSIIEMNNHLIGPLDIEMASFVNKYLKQKGINVILENKVNGILNNKDNVILKLDDRDMTTDLVIMSVGIKAESNLASECNLELNNKGMILVNYKMQTSDNDIYALGDVVEIKSYITNTNEYIPLATPVNKQARIVANNIFGMNSEYVGSGASSILKIFDMSVAMTGINEMSAKRLNIDYDKIYITAYSHATYYPNSNPMTIKVIYEKRTGRILGSQIVGYDTVDKRCDVLATAIYSKLTAYDLSEIDLCYSPPFSSAKDPVNIIGNAIVNILENNVKNTYVEDLENNNDKIILDVRTKKEYKLGSIYNSINIPLDELRESLNKLNKDKEIIVYCHSGMRSYIACRILENNGYKVYNLSGGYALYKSIKDVN